MWGQAYTHFVCMSSMNCFPCAFLHKYIHFYACIHSQVDNNTTIRDLTNLCVMVLLQQTISWALAFQSVVWDVARIAEIQIIHWDVARIAGIKDIHFHFVRASIAKTSCYIAFKGEWPDRSLSDGACNHIFSLTPKISSWMVAIQKSPPEVGHARLSLGAVLLGRLKGGAGPPRERVWEDGLPLVT